VLTAPVLLGDEEGEGLNALGHFLLFGEEEFLIGSDNRGVGVSGVDLRTYAEENTDVADLVETGGSTFFQHFLQFGRFETPPRPGVDEDATEQGTGFAGDDALL
jgi:hypothetical protein